MDTTIPIDSEFIPLAALIKLAGVADSGGAAKRMVQSGVVYVNGRSDTRRAAKIRAGDVVSIEGPPRTRIRVVRN